MFVYLFIQVHAQDPDQAQAQAQAQLPASLIDSSQHSSNTLQPKMLAPGTLVCHSTTLLVSLFLFPSLLKQ